MLKDTNTINRLIAHLEEMKADAREAVARAYLREIQAEQENKRVREEIENG